MRATGLVSLLAALALAAPAPAAGPALDPDVVKGIQLVDDGEYDAAIVTLDAAARRLAADPAKVGDLSQAYLHLGIAYVGKGHEAAAKAKFREAVSRIRDLTLSPDRYPPKVIDLFEAARDEARAASPAASAAPTVAAAAPATAAAPKKKGGSTKVLLIGGGVAAAGAAVALGGGGGGGGGNGSGPAVTPTTTLASNQRFSEVASVYGGAQTMFPFTTTGPGRVEATVTWQNRNIRLTMDCQERNPPYTPCNGQYNRTSDETATYTFVAGQKEYLLVVSSWDEAAVGVNTWFTIEIRYP